MANCMLLSAELRTHQLLLCAWITQKDLQETLCFRKFCNSMYTLSTTMRLLCPPTFRAKHGLATSGLIINEKTAYRRNFFIGRSCIGGLGGACAGHAPQGSRFFRLDILNFQNITGSGVSAPPLYEVDTPPTGNPGSARHCLVFKINTVRGLCYTCKYISLSLEREMAVIDTHKTFHLPVGRPDSKFYLPKGCFTGHLNWIFQHCINLCKRNAQLQHSYKWRWHPSELWCILWSQFFHNCQLTHQRRISARPTRVLVARASGRLLISNTVQGNGPPLFHIGIRWLFLHFYFFAICHCYVLWLLISKVTFVTIIFTTYFISPSDIFDTNWKAVAIS